MIKRPASDFHYEFFDSNILLIYDMDLGNKSVTNDIENVLTTISKIEEIDLSETKIAYQDSRGIFDGVKFQNRKAQFYSLNKKTKEEVLNLLNS